MIKLYINDEIPITYLTTGEYPLSSALPYSRIRQLQATDNVKIVLDAGTYLLTEAMQFHCNLTIIGAPGVTIKIEITDADGPGSAPSFMHNDNYYLGCAGNADHEVDILLKDIQLEFSDNHTYPFLPGSGHGSHTCIKLKHTKNLHLDNVKISTDHDCINNVMIYDSHNVIVENCHLYNTHEIKTEGYQYHDIGGNLWFVGNNYDVVVRNNRFYKEGNDEALGIYGQGERPEGDYDFRRNIRVEGNTFEYGSLEGASVPCDTLITIQSSASQRPIRFDNITFDGNHFIINDLVKNLFWLIIQNPLTRVHDTVFSSNLIELNGFQAANASINIFHLGCASQAQDAEISIEHNRLISSCSVDASSTATAFSGLHFLSQQGGKAIIRHNTISIQNVDDETYIANPTEDTHRITLLYRNGYNASTDIIGNNANGLATLVRIASPSGESVSDRIITSELRIIGNTLIGCTRISAQLTDQLCVTMHHNIIKSNSYYYGFLNKANFSSISYCHNRVRLAPRPNESGGYSSISGVFYSTNNDPAATIEQIRLVGNTVTGRTNQLEHSLAPVYGIEVRDNEYINE